MDQQGDEAWKTAYDALDRLLLAARAERDEARAEVERLADWKAQALEVWAEWERTWEAAGRPGRLGSSKAVAIRDEVEQLRDQLRRARYSHNLTRNRAEDAEAEREALAATVARVEALADLWAHVDSECPCNDSLRAADLRAALDAPTPASGTNSAPDGQGGTGSGNGRQRGARELDGLAGLAAREAGAS